MLGIRAEFQPGSAGRQTERLLSKGRKDSPAPDPFSVNTGSEGWHRWSFLDPGFCVLLCTPGEGEKSAARFDLAKSKKT